MLAAITAMAGSLGGDAVLAVLVLVHLAIALITYNLLAGLAPVRRARSETDGQPRVLSKADSH